MCVFIILGVVDGCMVAHCETRSFCLLVLFVCHLYKTKLLDTQQAEEAAAEKNRAIVAARNADIR